MTSIPLGPSNHTNGQCSFDLHGSSVQDAKKTLDRIMKTAEEHQLAQVTVITGVGKHSKNNYSVLFRKTVPAYFEQPEIASKIIKVKKDHRGAYEIIFKEDNQIKIIKKRLSSFLQPAAEFASIKQKETQSAEDQFNLSIFYLQGIGTPTDIKESERLMNLAAKNGSTPAKTQLGLMYDSGFMFKQNNKKALKWHIRAAQANDPLALFNLGSYYWMGKIVVRDDLKAVEYLSRAADLGEISAIYNLAQILLQGSTVIPQDGPRAKKLFKQGAKVDPGSQLMLGKQHLFGWGIPKNNQKAHKNFLKALPDPIAQYYLGRIYSEGLNGAPNPQLAYYWFSLAAEQGDKEARGTVAMAMIKGKVLPLNVQKGLQELESLAKDGDAQSAEELAIYFLYGLKNKIKKDFQRALPYLKQAALENRPEALRELATLHLNNRIEDSNPSEGERYLRKAAQAKDPAALFQLGLLLSDTRPEEAFNAYKEAADLQFGPAECMLGLIYLDEAKQDLGLTFLTRAAKQGLALAQCFLGEELSKSEVKEEQSRAVSFFASAAAKGHKDAYRYLALCYFYGRGIARNISNALHWFNKCDADQLMPMEKCLLGKLYADPQTEHFHLETAIPWLAEALDGSYEKAAHELIYLYKTQPQARPQIMKILKKAALQNSPWSLKFIISESISNNIAIDTALLQKDIQDTDLEFTLGVAYQEGRGVPKDLIEACRWYRKAALKKDPVAATALACLLLSGMAGTLQNLDEVQKFLNLGVSAKHDLAELTLGELYLFHSDDPATQNLGIDLIKRASEQGNLQAAALLATIQQNEAEKAKILEDNSWSCTMM